MALNKFVLRSLARSWLSFEQSHGYIGFEFSEPDKVVTICMQNPGIFAGSPFADALFQECGCTVDWLVNEGEIVETTKTEIATVRGAANDIMLCERSVIALLARSSAIATFAKRIDKNVLAVSWKGRLRVPFYLTPGFELVETYAMMLSGVMNINSSVVVQHGHTRAFGGVEKAINSIRSRVGSSTKVDVVCKSFPEADLACAAGANVVVLEGVKMEDLKLGTMQLKSDYPEVEIQYNGEFDESDVAGCALSHIDYLSTCKFICRGIFGFQMVFKDIDRAAAAQGSHNIPPLVSQKPLSPSGTEPAEDTNSAPVSVPKKARLDGKQTDSPKPSKTSGDTSNSRSVPVSGGSVLNSGSNLPKEQNVKRFQRNQRHFIQSNSKNSTLKNQPPSTQAQLLQMTVPRFPPSNPIFRANMPQQSQQQSPGLMGTIGNPLLNQQCGLGFRLPNQPLQQRMNSHPLSLNAGICGGANPIGSNFMSGGMPPQNQQNPQSNNIFPMFGTGTGPGMLNAGLGIRPGFQNGPICRSCGTLNGPGLHVCRNCRISLR